MRWTVMASLTLFVPSALLPLSARAQDADAIRDAMRAAPPAIAAEATIMDWDDRTLREGTNGWVCMPSMPGSPGSPMCLDEPWLEWIGAWSSRATPSISRIGFGYMLAGDAPDSNLDPFADGPTPDNEWMEEGRPHVMIVVPDLAILRGLPTDYRDGGPWVMWRGTPYAHVMVPVDDR